MVNSRKFYYIKKNQFVTILLSSNNNLVVYENVFKDNSYDLYDIKSDSIFYNLFVDLSLNNSIIDNSLQLFALFNYSVCKIWRMKGRQALDFIMCNTPFMQN